MLIVLEVPALHGLFKITGLTGEQWIWVVVLSVAPLLIMEIVKGFERLINKNK
jgi:Ca2+-transporting ATPase